MTIQKLSSGCICGDITVGVVVVVVKGKVYQSSYVCVGKFNQKSRMNLLHTVLEK